MRHTAHYLDGRTAERKDVYVQPVRTGLQLYAADGDALGEWPYPGLYPAEEIYGDGPVRLRHRERGEAMLVFPTASALREIEQISGRRLRSGGLLRPTLWVGALAAVLLVAVTVAAVWILPGTLAPVLARAVPEDWERALGALVVEQLQQASHTCSGTAGGDALRALTERISPSDSLNTALRVHVLDDDRVNAFAAPGGHILLMRGLIEAAQSPAELAGVLAHEMAHVELRHAMEGLIRAMGAALIIDAVLGDSSGLEAAASRLAQALLVLSHSREAELEADARAAELLNAAGVGTQGLVEFLRRVDSTTPAGLGLLSTHPVSVDRLARIEATAGDGPAALAPAQWAALRAACKRSADEA